MKSYAVGLLRRVGMGPAIVQYLQRIDATLAPYDGRFLVHGGDKTMHEGSDPGAFIVIEFPSRSHVDAWYASPAYQAIIHLRAEHSDSTIFVVDGVGRDHRATDVLG